MSCHEINGELLLIDCGVLFPGEEHPGVDLILPALDYLDDKLDRVQALVLTHGHEDHIGAVPYLLRQRSIPVYGSKLTLALVREKLKEHRIRDVELREVAEGDRVLAGNEFDLEFMSVNHSIPDALAVVVRTTGGTLLHTGDFKMDQLPLDHRLTDLRGFARVGEEGVDLFMVDSTNAETPGFTLPERDLMPAIQRVFESSKKKIVVACFASHVHRVQQIMAMAEKHGRKVCYVGRSMIKNMGIARDLGFLRVPGNTLIELSALEDYPDDQVVVISTGSQGEPLSALARMANQSHPVISLEPGDTVLLASSLIPGNENAVGTVINGLTRLGARVIHKGNALVHVSGHACAGELLYCYNIVQPRNVMPVHGEVRHLRANADLAIATGIPAENVVVAEDGVVVDVANHQAKIVGRVLAPYIFVDGSSVGDLDDDALSDRRILGEEGFISIILAVDVAEAELVNGPTISARGFGEAEGTFDDITDEVAVAVREALAEGITDTYRLQQVVRRTVGRWVSKTHRRRPMIVPVVVGV